MSNLAGVLMSKECGGYRLSKQTHYGEEYSAFAYTMEEAWQRLSNITGRSVIELKRLPLTRI